MLIERATTRDGYHLFVYPFDGRAVHEGMAALIAYRLSRVKPISFSFAINDYGFELLSPDPVELAPSLLHGLFSPDKLANDLVASLNATELARRHFREVARIAGLIQEGLPHRRKSARQLQVSSNLFWEVFTKYDPDNLLIWQSNSEVLERQLENSRLTNALQRITSGHIVLVDVPKVTPLAFPLLVDWMRASVSSELLADRVRKMQRQLEE